MPAGSARRPRTLIAARSLCRLRHFDLSALPESERKAALRNVVLAWRPFVQADHAVVWGRAGALVMAWDAAAARAALATLELDARSTRVVPEVLWREPMQEGVRLIDGIDGVEAQRWQQGLLVASRWWPALPSASEWHNFLHAAQVHGEGPHQALPALARPAWLGTPWARPRALEAAGGALARWESLATWSVAAGLLAATAALAHRQLAAEQDISLAQDEKRALETSLGPTLAARERALQQGAELQALSGRLVAPQPLEVLQHLAEVLPKKGVLLKELELTGSKLRLGLELADGVARSVLIRDLQSGGWFKDVAEAKDTNLKGGVSLQMAIDGPQPLAARAGVAAPPPVAAPIDALPGLPRPATSPLARVAPSEKPPGAD